MSACSIRLAIRDDAEVINGIQNHYVVHSTATFLTEPLTLEQRLAWLDGRSQAHPVTVAQADDGSTSYSCNVSFEGRNRRRVSVFTAYHAKPRRRHPWCGRALARIDQLECRFGARRTVVDGFKRAIRV